MQCLHEISLHCQHYIDELEQGDHTHGYRAPEIRSARRRGRPRFDIQREQLEYLSSLSFSWAQIASMLGVTRMTMYRRRQELGLLSEPIQVLDDDELRHTIEQIRREQPEIGEVIVMGEIRSRGIRVTRERVRRAIRETDHLNTPMRWRGGLVARHPYSVPGPNSLWHNYWLVVHCLCCCKCLFLCSVAYRQASQAHSLETCDSRCYRWVQQAGGLVEVFWAQTVYSLFLDAVRQYSLPSRVRSDQGRENYLVAQHMLEFRGTERRSMLIGSSVHNQRIERFWRDLFRCVIGLYHRLWNTRTH